MRSSKWAIAKLIPSGPAQELNCAEGAVWSLVSSRWSSLVSGLWSRVDHRPQTNDRRPTKDQRPTTNDQRPETDDQRTNSHRSVNADLARQAVSPRCVLRRRGHELFLVLGSGRARRALPLRRGRAADAHRPA